jgi:hypothetical protein
MAISERPWSDFSDKDYTIQQLHRAALIHTHTGAPDTKDNEKVAVLEPDGTLNRGGVHAAASVLAGGRGGVDAPAADKRAAARRLITLYGELKETPPESIKRLAAG